MAAIPTDMANEVTYVPRGSSILCEVCFSDASRAFELPLCGDRTNGNKQ